MKNQQNLREVWDTTKYININVMEVSLQERSERKEQKFYLQI